MTGIAANSRLISSHKKKEKTAESRPQYELLEPPPPQGGSFLEIPSKGSKPLTMLNARPDASER